MSKLIITRMDIRGGSCVLTTFWEEDRAAEFRFQSVDGKRLLGNIYVGYVEKVAENIQAAFVRLEDGQIGYYPLREQAEALFASPGRKPPLRPGDQILVQVNRDAMKGKMPSLTTNLNFTGQYLVLTSAKHRLGLSGKLQGEAKARLKKWLTPEVETGNFGLVARTNAREASKEAIFEELSYLKKRRDRVCQQGKSRVPGSLLEAAEPSYIEAIRDAYKETLTEIVTDDPALFEEIGGWLETFWPGEQRKLRFYQDPLLPLLKLYALPSALEKAAQEKVWLKSGGYLVIQQTEAFVSVDVNTGKFAGKKKAQETFRKINLEAAGEIARQLRLRNLSGMILIDFINLENPDHQQELFHVLDKHLRRDPVKTAAVDITKLNIIEVTRQKVRRPLGEELAQLAGISSAISTGAVKTCSHDFDCF